MCLLRRLCISVRKKKHILFRDSTDVVLSYIPEIFSKSRADNFHIPKGLNAVSKIFDPLIFVSFLLKLHLL